MYLTTTKPAVYDPSYFFLVGLVGYVSLYSMATVLQSELLKMATYAAAMISFLGALAIAGLLQKESRIFGGYWIALALFYCALAASLFLNGEKLDPPELIKLCMAPAMLLIGGAFEESRSSLLWERQDVRLLFWSLAAMPVLVWLWQIGFDKLGYEDRPGFPFSNEGTEFAFFANRNNAALYAVTLISLFTVLSGRVITNALFYLLLCAAFGTLGVLFAAAVALSISVAGWRAIRALLLASIVSAVAYWYAPQLPGLNRIQPVVNSFHLLSSGSIDLRAVTYGQLVELLGTTDLSFFFRLKHWLNLLEIFQAGSLYEWFLGYGQGASVRLSKMSLVPHNDYLRFLFEFGLLGLGGFVSLLIAVIYSFGRKWEAVPFLIIVFYFFSENLVNNYLAMSIFFFSAGSLTARIRNRPHG
jgi:hypothetical protein